METALGEKLTRRVPHLFVFFEIPPAESRAVGCEGPLEEVAETTDELLYIVLDLQLTPCLRYFLNFLFGSRDVILDFEYVVADFLHGLAFDIEKQRLGFEI